MYISVGPPAPASAPPAPAASLEGNQGVPMDGVGSDNWFDRDSLSILYMFKQTLTSTDVQTPLLGTPLLPLPCIIYVCYIYIYIYTHISSIIHYLSFKVGPQAAASPAYTSSAATPALGGKHIMCIYIYIYICIHRYKHR